MSKATPWPRIQPHILLRLMHQRPNNSFDWSSVPECEWRAFARACDFHQLNALAFRRLDSLTKQALPSDVLAHLEDRFYKVAAINFLLAKQLVALISRFEKESIPVLAYKGPLVAIAVYGDLALREFQDLDLLVPEKQIQRAIRLMTAAGFERDVDCSPERAGHRKRYHHLVFHASDRSHSVELHWKFAGNLWRSYSPDIDRVWARCEAVDFPHGRLSAMCREDTFLALCFHGAKHRWWCLKWLVDLAEMLRHAGAWDWSRIEEMTASRRGLRDGAALGIQLAHELLGAPVPPPAANILPLTPLVRRVADEIREEILSCGWTDGDPDRTLLGLEGRVSARMKYRGTLIIRTAALFYGQVITVRPRDRALIRLPKRLDFLYRYIRLMRLAVKSAGIAAHAIRRAAASLL